MKRLRFPLFRRQRHIEGLVGYNVPANIRPVDVFPRFVEIAIGDFGIIAEIRRQKILLLKDCLQPKFLVVGGKYVERFLGEIIHVYGTTSWLPFTKKFFGLTVVFVESAMFKVVAQPMQMYELLIRKNQKEPE